MASAEELLQRITLQPGKRGGKPCIRGMRITDLSRLSGALFIVGYGTSAEEMIAAGRFRLMYQVP